MVKRTSVNLDMELVQEASDVLGTERMIDTLHSALREVVRTRRLEELVEHDFPDLSLEALREMRKPAALEHLLG
jgi:Arc/MetJ family transcription regulator